VLTALDLFPEQAVRQQLTASDLASFDTLCSLGTDWHEGAQRGARRLEWRQPPPAA
jgi:hypothetical protein